MIQTALKSRWLALAVLCAATLMIIIDQTIVSVALPAIRVDLGFSESGLAWVVNAYVIPFGGLLLLAGRLGDLVGRKRMFIAGVLLFTGASLLCGLAGNAAMLVGARFLQGFGGAMAAAVTLGMIVALFPAPGERARAIGAFSFVQAAGGSLGSLLGGVVTQVVSWPWIFYLNLPIGIVTVLFAMRVLTVERGVGLRAGADAAGAALVTAGLMLAGYTIVGVAEHGLPHTLGFGAVAVVLLAAFVVREKVATTPLLPPRMFRSRNVSAANAVQALLIAGMFGFLFFSVLYLRRSLAYDALETGLGMVPVAVAIGAVSLGLSARLPTRFALLAGLTLIVVGLGLLARAPIGGSFSTDVLPAMLLIGVGFGMAMPALMTLGMSGATSTDAGLVSGLFNTSQQVGGALGLSVLAGLAAHRQEGLLAGGATEAVARTGGYHLAFGVAAGLGAAALVTAAVALRQKS